MGKPFGGGSVSNKATPSSFMISAVNQFKLHCPFPKVEQQGKLIEHPPRGNIVVPNNPFDASILEATNANMVPGGPHNWSHN